MTDKTETVNWRELEPGDRVSVTFEAISRRVDTDPLPLGLVHSDGGTTWFTRAQADAMTFTRKPRPIEVGDMVRRKGLPDVGTVLAIDGNAAWVRLSESGPLTYSVTDLTRITGEVDQ